MKRFAVLRRQVRVGTAARARVQAGGKLAMGRASATLAEYRALKARVMARCGGRDEIYPALRATELHHVLPRSHGGCDTDDNVIALARATHRRTEAPFIRGRLVIHALGHGRFEWEILGALDKWSPRRVWASGITAGAPPRAPEPEPAA